MASHEGSRNSVWTRTTAHRTVATVAGLTVLVIGSAQAADAARRFTIPTQPADAALRAFAAQAGRQVIFPYAAVAGRQAPALDGVFTTEEAAARLAASVGLTVRSANGRTISMVFARPVPERPPPRRPEPPPRPTTPSPRLAEPPRSVAPPDVLDEVVVTATRQPDTVNRVPLSITAHTQRMLDERGIHTLGDLQGDVPSLQITGPGGTALAYPTIRGIQGSGVGVAATTGLYLDDTPLQKRNPAGGSNTGYANGTPVPPLFDLDRVEVLRGPQGTLFGGSSEGGTIRFITPAPSLTRSSAYVRSEVATIRYGEPSYELGVALSGPIVKDKLAFRASLYGRHTGGWIDLVDRFTGKEKLGDANKAGTRLGRLTLLWAPTDQARVTLAWLASRDRSYDVVANTSLSTTQPIVEPTSCYLTTAVTPTRPAPYPTPVALGDASCAAATAQGRANFTRPGAVYGPYALGPDDRIGQPDFTWPATTNLKVASATLDYEFDKLSLKSISSYIEDGTNQRGGSGTYISTTRNANATYGNIAITRGLDVVATCRDACMEASHIDTYQRRYGFTQEFRLASAADARRLSWVAGVFYSNQRVKQQQYATITEQESLAVFGLTTAQRFGVPPFTTPQGAADGYTFLNNGFKDVEIAAFGEGNYLLTDRLKLTAGLRVARVEASFHQVTYGPATGYLVPTDANGGLTAGSTAEAPVTPRVSAQYLLDDRNLVYATVSNGYRAGGANPPLPSGLCGPALAIYGLQAQDVPTTYGSDSVWNYEAGAKLRLFGSHVQLNSSAYRIDWRDVQLTASLGSPCGIPFILNSGSARVEGIEVESQARLLPNLSVDVAFSVSNARYLTDAIAIRANPNNPASSPLLSAVAGQRFPVSPATIQFGARYDVDLGKAKGYLRAQWNFAKAAHRTATDVFGASSYAPDRTALDTQRTDLRAGVKVGGLDANLFVNNLFNSRRGVVTGGRSLCAGAATGGTAACTSYSTYTPDFRLTSAYLPRQVGLQVAYRY